MTIVLTVGLGVVAGVFQLALDLQQEKDAVEINAQELVESLAPTAATAIYNFDEAGAEQVAIGLFTQRAVVAVSIWEGGRLFLERVREPERTLPDVGAITTTDHVVLTRELLDPSGASAGGIGRIDVTVDRSIVPPAIVDRMFMYFVVAVMKNSLFGALLVILVFSGLARHVLRLAKSLDGWTPEVGPIAKPTPPRLLRRTELDLLGAKIAALTADASETFRSLQTSHEEVNLVNSALRHHSEDLSKTLEKRNQDLVNVNRQLVEIASRDSLTSLYNRAFFEQRATAIIKDSAGRGGELAVFVMDVDHFKAYNDLYGHQDGDECLRQVATGLAEVIDVENGLLARYGGEEFVALIPGLDRDGAAAAGQRLVDAIAELQIEHARSLTDKNVTISVGAACLRTIERVSLDALVGAADRALYEAKRQGRARRVVASEDLMAAVKREDEATEEMLRAVRAGAFEPFFQPQVDARTGAIVGLEALARWRQPDGAIVEPAAFLPRAQNLGLLSDIDEMIQSKALAIFAAWRDEGIAPARLSMNLSEDRLLSADALRLIERYPSLADRTISFELLESILLERQSTVFQMRLDELRDSGVVVEIDDFGTGHASILGLATVLPERVKIARELVCMLGLDDRRLKLIRSVVDIAQAFDIDLIAEGVETREQAEILIGLNCPIQQGYLHCRPMPPEQVERRLRAAADDPAIGERSAACA